MAGCDGRQKDRNYYREVAEDLPEDRVILTAGCARYRCNKLLAVFPAFLSSNVVRVLVENFDIKRVGTVEEDIEAMKAGE